MTPARHTASDRRRLPLLFILAAIATSPLGAASHPSVVELSELDGSDGFAIVGALEGDHSAWSIDGIGDLNADGIDDLLIGAPIASPHGLLRAGQSFVVFGSTEPFAAEISLSDLDGTNGFVMNGVGRRDESGEHVAGAGDINGDGIDDLAIGAEEADPAGRIRAGEVYVVFGSADPFAAVLELGDLDGTNGFALRGARQTDSVGASVAAAGDFNGDGLDDLLIGGPDVPDGPGLNTTGACFLVFGSTEPFPAALELSDLDGTNGFVLYGIDAIDNTGDAASGAGDVNGDGLDDLLIGAWLAQPHDVFGAGEVYVVFGSTTPFPAEFRLADLDGENGFTIFGTADANIGDDVDGAGDLNGDGLDDIVLGSGGADPDGLSNAGQTYVLFGRTGGFPPTIELSSFDGRHGFVVDGIDIADQAGSSAAGAGDVNRDGLNDLVIGAHRADPNGIEAGEAYLLFGRGDPFPATVELAELEQRTGFVLNGANDADQTGQSSAAVGDLNGDGFDDFAIGSRARDVGTRGRTYVVFGQPHCRLPLSCGVDRAGSSRRPVDPMPAGEPFEDEYLVGDWDGNGCSDLAVRRDNLVLMSSDDDGFHDLEQIYALGNDDDEYLVGDWNQDGCDDLAVRRGSEILMDTNFDDTPDIVVDFRPVGTTEYLVGDVDGDGADDLLARVGDRLIGDLFPWDGIADGVTQYGDGDTEDDYFIGHWAPDFRARQTLAVRRDRRTLMNANFDLSQDFIQVFGGGNFVDQYLIGDWDGDGRDNLATRIDNFVRMEIDFDPVPDLTQRYGRGTE